MLNQMVWFSSHEADSSVDLKSWLAILNPVQAIKGNHAKEHTLSKEERMELFTVDRM